MFLRSWLSRGADGDYELVEDRDSDESLVRTKIHWNDDEESCESRQLLEIWVLFPSSENCRFVFLARTSPPNS